ncbi:MAG TPA: preprotein translocase subunit SecG [Bacteroidia bacterium]|nr:preprotein translocase subunit SecG [Bacteroidia bacterium]
MYTAITVFIMIICLLLALVVLVQNSKGGGLASGFSSSNQIMGVRKTTDVLERLTWGLVIALMVFSVAGTMLMPKTQESQAASAIQEQIDNAAIPTPGGAQPPLGSQPAENQPAQNAPATETPATETPAADQPAQK